MTAQIAVSGESTVYSWIDDQEISSADGWVEFSGSRVYEAGQTLTIYVENSDLNAFYIDDFSITVDGKPVA